MYDSHIQIRVQLFFEQNSKKMILKHKNWLLTRVKWTELWKSMIEMMKVKMYVMLSWCYVLYLYDTVIFAVMLLQDQHTEENSENL